MLVALAFFLMGCGPTVLEVPRLDVADTLILDDAPIGMLTAAELVLQNVGTGSADVRVSSEGPIIVPAFIAVPAADSAAIVVAIEPVGPDRVDAVVILRTGFETHRVAVVVVPDPDVDGDGAWTVLAGGDDCDDFDAERFVGADEVCDGLDQDCDGAVDEDAVNASLYYEDRDWDSWGDEHSTTLACTLPNGFARRPGDCDDLDRTVNPDAAEVWYDGVDQDCDTASDYDADADGFDTVGHGGADCNDRSASIHPGAEEMLDDDIDQDCDGWADERRPEVGELVITEVLPLGFVGPAFVEVTSTASDPVELQGLPMGSALGFGTWPNLALGPGEAAVACVSFDPACDAVMPAMVLAGAVEVIVGDTHDVVPLDRLPHSVGVATELTAIDVDLNDVPSAWCAASFTGATGDFGSPGTPEATCSAL